MSIALHYQLQLEFYFNTVLMSFTIAFVWRVPLIVNGLIVKSVETEGTVILVLKL